MRYVSLVIVVGLVTLLGSCINNSIDTSQAQQFTSDTTSIAHYVAQNNIPAIKLPVGVWYIIDSGASNAIRATYSDTISVTYTMSVMGTSSILDKEDVPLDFNLSNLITGVRMAVPYFPKGTKGRIFIPSFYGYGANPTASGVPANANLVFDFTVKNVKDYHLKADTAAIDSYLQSKNITNAVRDPSGMRYTIDTTGVGGAGGIIGKTLELKYGLKLLSGNQIVPYTSVTFPYYYMPLSWQIVLPQVTVGSYVTLYVPSSLGYGPSYYSSTGISIPASSILIYQIKIVSAN